VLPKGQSGEARPLGVGIKTAGRPRWGVDLTELGLADDSCARIGNATECLRLQIQQAWPAGLGRRARFAAAPAGYNWPQYSISSRPVAGCCCCAPHVNAIRGWGQWSPGRPKAGQKTFAPRRARRGTAIVERPPGIRRLMLFRRGQTYWFGLRWHHSDQSAAFFYSGRRGSRALAHQFMAGARHRLPEDLPGAGQRDAQ